MKEGLSELLALRSGGKRRGVYSICSAHPWVIEAALRQSIQDHSPLLSEATSNQVNQFGGYTGMRPPDFRARVEELARQAGFDRRRLILGGDHLGPNPWRHLPAREAMANAQRMVAEYVRAGFSKIHLDASMRCADDRSALSDECVAERATQLCLAAEQASTGTSPVYVIGTEVPAPGGGETTRDALPVTQRAAAAHTLAVHRHAFRKAGLGNVLDRVIALVVQPGVEFDQQRVLDYVPEKVADLKLLLRDEPGLVFEAHSTDYQRPEAYRQLVRDGFAILKVGPALTFAMREALYALADIEQEIVPSESQSKLGAVVEEAMLSNPCHWEHHGHGDDHTRQLLRVYGYSDRIRYYWNVPSVQAAVRRLVENLSRASVPEMMLSRYLPQQYVKVRAGELENRPQSLILDKIQDALVPYAAACGPSATA